MKLDSQLIIASLLSIFFLSFHLADDIVRGFDRGGLSNLTAILIMVVWLYGTLVLAGRRSGYIISILFSLFGLAIPILHLRGKGVGGDFAKTSGAIFFIWTLLAIGVTSMFSVILAVHGLWRLRRSQSQ